MPMNPTAMEMKLVLAAISCSIRAVEEAQRGLEIQHRDLTRQAEWLKGEIVKTSGESPASMGEMLTQEAIRERERILSKFLARALTSEYEPDEIVLARWDGSALECLTHPDDIRAALNP